MICQSTFTSVYPTVTIGIDIFQVTATPEIIRFECCQVYISQVIINFTVRQEKIVCTIPPYFANIHTFIVTFIGSQTCMIIVNDTFRIIILRHHRLVVEHIEADSIAETTFQFIIPAHGKFPSTIAQSSIVYFCTVIRSNTTDARNRLSRTDHVTCRTLIEVSGNRQTVL